MAQEAGLIGLHDYPVTVHGATQRLAADHALIVGLLLDNLPADVQFTAMEQEGGGQATASLVRYMAIGAQPQRDVHLPGGYGDLASGIYERGGLRRGIVAAEDASEQEHAPEASQPEGETAFEREGDERRGVLKLTVSSAGSSTAALERKALAGAASYRVTQIDIPLSEALAPRMVARLREIGFFFGALLPEFRDGDVIRLQRLTRPASECVAPVLEPGAIRELSELVLSDAARVRELQVRQQRDLGA